MEHENCSCRSAIHKDAVSEKSVANVDDEKLSLDVYFECLQESSVTSWRSCDISIGSSKIRLRCHPSAILYDFSKIMERFPCHKCHKGILEPMLSMVVDKKHPYKYDQYFRKQVLKNLQWNSDRYDSEIVALSMSSLWLLNLPEQNLVEVIVSKLKLSFITPTVLTHYTNLWKPAQLKNCVKILEALGASFWKETRENHPADNEKLENVLFESLAVFFPLYIDAKWFDVDKLVIDVMKEKTGFVESWECLNNFTRKLHDTFKWKFNVYLATKHIEKMSLFIVALRKLDYSMPLNGTRDQVVFYYHQVMNRLVEAVREIGPDSIYHSIGHIFRHNSKPLNIINKVMFAIVQAARTCPREMDIAADLFDVFLSKIQEVLENDDLDHDDRKPNNVFAVQSSNSLDSSYPMLHRSNRTIICNTYLRRMFYCIAGLFNYRVVKKVNLKFLTALLELARFKCTLKLCDVRQIFVWSLSQNLCNSETLLKSGIAQTIYRNMMQLDDNCKTCAFVRESIYTGILNFLEPSKVDFSTERSAELAASLPYVIRNKQRLVDVMYPQGFALLTSRLKHGQDIDSLYLLSQTLQTKTKPQDVKSSVCLSELNEPVCESEPGTKIFVLDDGTKIRTRIAPLVQSSPFFSSLFDGRFAEATQREIRIHDVTTFQFCFLVNFTNLQLPETNMKFDLDFHTHLDLYKLSDKFLLDNLCASLAGSLRFLMTSRTLPEVYELALECACGALRIECMDFALNTDYLLERAKTMNNLFKTVSNKCLADDALEWLNLRCMKIRQDRDSHTEQLNHK